MMPNSPTLMLEDEHRFIAKVVSVAPVLADRLEAGQAVDADTLQGVVEFMRIFADKCHHGKEEELLFPLLGKKGVPLQGCPIGALIMEHGIRGAFRMSATSRPDSRLRRGEDVVNHESRWRKAQRLS